jgi:hypothetical protein
MMTVTECYAAILAGRRMKLLSDSDVTLLRERLETDSDNFPGSGFEFSEHLAAITRNYNQESNPTNFPLP